MLYYVYNLALAYDWEMSGRKKHLLCLFLDLDHIHVSLSSQSLRLQIVKEDILIGKWLQRPARVVLAIAPLALNQERPRQQVQRTSNMLPISLTASLFTEFASK